MGARSAAYGVDNTREGVAVSGIMLFWELGHDSVGEGASDQVPIPPSVPLVPLICRLNLYKKVDEPNRLDQSNVSLPDLARSKNRSSAQSNTPAGRASFTPSQTKLGPSQKARCGGPGLTRIPMPPAVWSSKQCEGVPQARHQWMLENCSPPFSPL